MGRGGRTCSFRHLEVFVVHSADGHCIAAEFHDELAVAVDAYYVAFHALEGAGQDAKSGVVLGEFDEGIAQEGYVFWMGRGGFHERLHHAVRYAGGPARAAIVYQMVLGVVGF